METATVYGITASKQAPAPTFTPLALETRPAVDTAAAAAYYLSRRPQTLRGWASAENFPDGLRCNRINGRLSWPVESIRRLLGVPA